MQRSTCEEQIRLAARSPLDVVEAGLEETHVRQRGAALRSDVRSTLFGAGVVEGRERDEAAVLTQLEQHRTRDASIAHRVREAIGRAEQPDAAFGGDPRAVVETIDAPEDRAIGREHVGVGGHEHGGEATFGTEATQAATAVVHEEQRAVGGVRELVRGRRGETRGQGIAAVAEPVVVHRATAAAPATVAIGDAAREQRALAVGRDAREGRCGGQSAAVFEHVEVAVVAEDEAVALEEQIDVEVFGAGPERDRPVVLDAPEARAFAEDDDP